MFQMKTLFYFFPCLRKVLFRKATKQDPIISRIKLLEEFENVILAINEIEEFHDVQYELHFTNTISDSQDFEEISSPIVKLPKSRFLTYAATNSSAFETHTPLVDIISEPQETELQLNTASIQNEICLTRAIIDLQDF